jgi:Predicted O-methyltransferase
VPANRIRLITGRATEVLPRMNDGAYDLVFVDADEGSVLDYVEHALRIARRGGMVLVAHALWRGRVADPRDATTPPKTSAHCWRPSRNPRR